MNQKTRHLALTARFVAFILLLGFTPLGMIPLGFIYVTTLCIPVVVGTMLLGPKTGLALGFCFGTVSALSAFGIAGTPSSLAATLVAASPVLALVMCYLPRLAVPLAVYGMGALVRRTRASRFAVPAAAAAGSICNTVLYLGLMLLFYTLLGLESTGLLALIGGTGLIAGGCEAAAAALISTPIAAALRRVQGRLAF